MRDYFLQEPSSLQHAVGGSESEEAAARASEERSKMRGGGDRQDRDEREREKDMEEEGAAAVRLWCFRRQCHCQQQRGRGREEVQQCGLAGAHAAVWRVCQAPNSGANSGRLQQWGVEPSRRTLPTAADERAGRGERGRSTRAHVVCGGGGQHAHACPHVPASAHVPTVTHACPRVPTVTHACPP